jgi:hypothetical protein
MKKIIPTIFWLTLIFCIESDARECSVKGRVVDDFGKPVTAAEIYYGGAFMDDVDAIVVQNKPDEAGFFSVSRTCQDRFFYLFIASPLDRANTVVAVEPPFTMQEGKTRDFPTLAGIKITEQNAELGDVKIQTAYKRVKINFQNERGEPLLPTAADAMKIHFVLRNEKGKFASTGGLYKKEAFSDASVLMSLPEGKWIVEIKLKEGSGKTLHPDQLVEVTRADADAREIVLKMSKDKKK